MNHPDFRIGGKVFATLGYPDAEWGMVKLTPEEQQNYVGAAPEAFSPANGAWGRKGSTMVRLKSARTPMARKALETAAGLAGKGAKPAGSGRGPGRSWGKSKPVPGMS